MSTGESSVPLISREGDREYGSVGPQSTTSWANSRRSSNLRNRGRSSVAKSSVPWRVLDRKGRFAQSVGNWNVARINRRYELYQADMYHTLINMRMSKIVLLLSALYIGCICIFALAYLLVPNSCGLETSSFKSAYYFSLETIVTIGYGLPANMKDSPYFNGCNSVLVLITAQSILGILLDAFAVGLVFTRFGRAQSRATTIVFSDIACINRSNPRKRRQLVFQVCEMRKHQLVEAHVRCYAIIQKGTAVTCVPLRLSHPDDELGAMVLLNIPCKVVHDIDQYSPLSCYGGGSEGSFIHDPVEPVLRKVDEEQGSREPVKGVPVEVHDYTDDEQRQKMSDHRIEVVVLVEGIDAITSDTLQARHSYTYADICWNHEFENCISSTSNGLMVDFEKFHVVKPIQ